MSKAIIAKNIADKFRKELGFVNRKILEIAESNNELEIVGKNIGFCHFHHRLDNQTTIYSLAVETLEQGKGWGRLLFFRVLCSAVEAGKKIIVAKCPDDLPSNAFYLKQGFILKEVLPGKKRQLNVWQYEIQLPFLFYCGDGGLSPFDKIASSVGRFSGFRSDRPSPSVSVFFVDNYWKKYSHSKHLAEVLKHKPILATVQDIEKEDNLIEVLLQAKELSEFCGRVLVIPKIKFDIQGLNFPYWWGFSVPTKYGGTKVESSFFGQRQVHLLGGSPRSQAYFANYLNVVSLDGNVATKMAQKFGKSIWQNNSGIKISNGCYDAFRISLIEQKEWWYRRNTWKWEDEPLTKTFCSN